MKAPRLSYKDDRARRLADMEALGAALVRIREIVRQDKIASYAQNGTKFGNVFSDALLESYLREIAQKAKKVAA